MSLIGKLPIPVPSGVEVALDDTLVTVKGPKGTLSHTVASPITVGREDDGTIIVARPNDGPSCENGSPSGTPAVRTRAPSSSSAPDSRARFSSDTRGVTSMS